MKAIQHHIYAIKVSFEALSKGKYLTFFIPGLIVGLFYYWAFSSTEELNESVSSYEGSNMVVDFFVSGAKGVIGFGQAILLVIFQFFVLTILSPFNSFLSEKFDADLTGRKFETGFVRILNDLLRAILVAIIALFLELIFMGVWWILSWLPLIGLLDPIMYFLIASFFFGFAFYDYSLERHNIGTFRSLGFAFSKMGHMIISGSIFTLIFMIPIAGIILAPVLVTLISTGVYIKLNEKTGTPTQTQ